MLDLDAIILVSVGVLLILCFVYGLMLIGLRVFKAVDRVLSRVDRIERNVDFVMNHVADASNAVSAASDAVKERVEVVGSQVGGLIDGYVIGTILVSVFALVRNLYVRLNTKEKKESLSEKSVFKLFDVLALAAIVPLFATHGGKAALGVWSTLRSLCLMIRTACEGFHLFSLLFSSKDVPFIGESGIKGVVDAVDELSERLDEKKQSGKAAPRVEVNFDEFKSSPAYDRFMEHQAKSTVVERVFPKCSDCNERYEPDQSDWDGCCQKCGDFSEPLWKPCVHCRVTSVDNHKRTVCQACFNRGIPDVNAVEQWPVLESPVLTDICHLQASGKVPGDHRGVRAKVKMPIAEPVDQTKRHPLIDLTAVFSEEKEKKQILNLERIIADKPWLLPVVFLIIFACLLLLSRYFHSPKEKKEAKFAPQKMKKRSKRHYDGSSSVGDSEDTKQGLFETDEQGNMVARLGKRAKATAAKAARAEQQNYENPHEKASSEEEYANKRSVSLMKEAAKKVKTVVPKKKDWKEKCTVSGCKGDCGLYCPQGSSKAGVAKAAKAIKKKVKAKEVKPVKTEKKESLVNGKRFNVSHVAKSIGRADTESNSMNCTLLWNGLILCSHIFAKGEDVVTVMVGSVSKVLKKIDFITIGNDLMFYKNITKEFPGVKFLRASRPYVGQKVRVISYDSEEDMKKGITHDDSGKIRSVIVEENEEKGWYDISSIDGSCASPVVDVDGKVVGFHNFTNGSETTGFIPLTDMISQKAAGSSTF